MPKIAVDLSNKELQEEINRLRAQGFTRAVSKKPGKKKKEDPAVKMNALAEKLKLIEMAEKLKEIENES